MAQAYLATHLAILLAQTRQRVATASCQTLFQRNTYYCTNVPDQGATIIAFWEQRLRQSAGASPLVLNDAGKSPGDGSKELNLAQVKELLALAVRVQQKQARSPLLSMRRLPALAT